MSKTRFDFVLRNAKNGIRASLMFVICAAVFSLFQGPAAASPASNALSTLPGGDRTFLYLNFTEADKIIARLRGSEVMRFLVSKGIMRMEKMLPVKEVAVLVTDAPDGSRELVRVQLAMSFGDGYRDILNKIEKKTATGEEIAASFNLKLIESLGFSVEVDEPDPGEQRAFYSLEPFGLYLSAREGMLILGSSQETVNASLAALRSQSRRFAYKTNVEGKNNIIVKVGEEMTYLLKGFYSDTMSLDEPIEPTPDRFVMEANVKLLPKGWDLDIFTNSTEIFLGKEYQERMFVKPKGSFHQAGGGELLAMLDSTPYTMPISNQINGFFEFLMNAGLTVRAEDIDFSEIDRVNIGITNDPGNPKDVRAYVHLSSRKEGVIRRIGGAIAESFESVDNKKKLKELKIDIEKMEAPEGKKTFMIYLGKENDFPNALRKIFITIGDEGILCSIMPPSLLYTPFEKDSSVYADLMGKEDLMEKIYIDLRGIRKAFAALHDDMAPYSSRRAERKMAFLLIPFMDIREITGELFSAERFRFSFRTGWFDIDERIFLNKLMSQ